MGSSWRQLEYVAVSQIGAALATGCDEQQPAECKEGKKPGQPIDGMPDRVPLVHVAEDSYHGRQPRTSIPTIVRTNRMKAVRIIFQVEVGLSLIHI